MGFPAGSGVDVVARTLQEPLEQALGAKIVTDYRTGAGGNLASELVARARPDGHTLLLGTAATHGVNAALYRKLPFNYASTGNGTGTHLAFAEFNTRAGLEMQHIPYKGGPEALQGVLRGDACCIFNQVQTVLPQARAGKVRLLGVSTKTRVAAIPDVPAIADAGVPGFESYIWFGLFGPKGLDPQIAAKVNAAVREALDTPAIRQKLVDMGNTPRIETVEQFRATVKADRARWAEVVKASGAKVD